MAVELSEDFERGLTRSDVPGESVVQRGPDAYVRFAERWWEALGPTQLTLEEAKELPHGRLFALLKQSGTGAPSGADGDLHYVQIQSFDGDKITRTELFGDQRKGRAAAGLKP